MRLLKVSVPESVLVPLHAPDAVQETAFVDAQVRIAEPPLVTDVVSAERMTVGVAGAVTTTVVDWGAVVPPEPVHVMVYVVSAVRVVNV